jgi:hypothetical protein
VLGLLFTPTAMVIAQVILVTPIVAALARQVVEDLWLEYAEQLRSLGVTPAGAILLVARSPTVEGSVPSSQLHRGRVPLRFRVNLRHARPQPGGHTREITLV